MLSPGPYSNYEAPTQEAEAKVEAKGKAYLASVIKEGRESKPYNTSRQCERKERKKLSLGRNEDTIINVIEECQREEMEAYDWIEAHELDYTRVYRKHCETVTETSESAEQYTDNKDCLRNAYSYEDQLSQEERTKARKMTIEIDEEGQ